MAPFWRGIALHSVTAVRDTCRGSRIAVAYLRVDLHFLEKTVTESVDG